MCQLRSGSQFTYYYDAGDHCVAYRGSTLAGLPSRLLDRIIVRSAHEIVGTGRMRNVKIGNISSKVRDEELLVQTDPAWNEGEIAGHNKVDPWHHCALGRG